MELVSCYLAAEQGTLDSAWWVPNLIFFWVLAGVNWSSIDRIVEVLV